MQEDFLFFVWKYKLFDDYVLYNLEPLNFEIVGQGEHNYDAGPDFTGAKFKTNEAIWVGNVEIHLKSSDWNLHKHNLDKSYNNTVLQVVTKHDKDVYTEDGRLLPALEIRVNELMLKKYDEFVKNGKWIPCQNDIHLVDSFKLKMWFGNVLIERINNKAVLVMQLLGTNKNNWEETFYQLLAKSFGFKVNAAPFEWLAKSIPLNILAKHHNSILQLESLLFGQAGFLDDEFRQEEYYMSLKKEYAFLSNKYGLKPLEKHLWKFLRLRPSNFPYIRISQFAALINKSKSLFSKIIKNQSVNEIKNLFDTKASPFWDHHYTFEKLSDEKQKYFGEQAVNSVLINTVIPILFVYGKCIDNEEIKERAIHFLEELKPEHNKITKGWQALGLENSSAYYSQALIEQKNMYCDAVKCLKCGIGLEILKNQIK